MILHEFLSYELLRVIWWGLLGVLLIAFALMDGFDMGAMALLPFLGRNDVERRVIINTVGPTWEGNQVWFILGGGAIFAAWPPLYAVSFSGFYLAMFVVLAALIVRPVAFKYRSQREDARWRSRWDWALAISGAVPALLFGVAVGNVLQGVPFRLTDDLHIIHQGAWYAKFVGLLDPFSILAGLVSFAMLLMHGGIWVAIKTEGVVRDRAMRIGVFAALAAVLTYGIAGVWMAQGMEGYRILGTFMTDGPSNPQHFEVARSGSWLDVYAERPWAMIAPALGLGGGLLAALLLWLRRDALAFAASNLSILGVISSVGLVMFPFILPSSIDPNSSLLVWNASSSHLTLFIMLISTAIFLPIIIAYTAWVYKVLWGKVTEDDVSGGSHY